MAETMPAGGGTSERLVLETVRAWMNEGTSLFDAQVRGLQDEQLRQRSLLPMWTRAHVIAHVARNADALGNLLTWARTGVETPMYESAARRDADVEDTAAEAPEALRFDLDEAERRFANAVDALPASAWTVEVRTRTGRAIPAAEVPWMRCREVWVHAVDLASGASFADFPEALVAAFLQEVTDGFTARPNCGGIELVATDSAGRWAIGPRPKDEVVVVQGPAHDLLEWLIGRGKGTGLTSSIGVLPPIPAWL
jgi:maleylpyruvate isomerase